MAIPILTVDEIFSVKDKNTIMAIRELSEVQFEELVYQLNLDGQGYCKAMIIPSYFSEVDENSWRNIIKLYVQWQAMTQSFSEILQTLSINAYTQLTTLLRMLNDNFTLSAKQQITPNKSRNFRVINS